MHVIVHNNYCGNIKKQAKVGILNYESTIYINTSIILITKFLLPQTSFPGLDKNFRQIISS